jgi:hypothetical protein
MDGRGTLRDMRRVLGLSLLVAACSSSSSSTEGCEASEYLQTGLVTVPAEELMAALDENGELSLEDCQEFCAPGPGERVVECRAVGTHVANVECDVMVPVFCEGRRHAVVVSATRGRGPSEVAAWLQRGAHAEAASVPAFLALRRELLACGAGEDLARRALLAAADEIAHARGLGALAMRHGASIQPLSFRKGSAARDVEAIAIENAVEGCVNEAFAALVARHQAGHASELAARRAFAAIAPDELRHTALAWDLHERLWPELSNKARRRLTQRAERALRDLTRQASRTGLAPQTRSTLGLPSPREEARLARRFARQALPILTRGRGTK